MLKSHVDFPKVKILRVIVYLLKPKCHLKVKRISITKEYI